MSLPGLRPRGGREEWVGGEPGGWGARLLTSWRLEATLQLAPHSGPPCLQSIFPLLTRP